MPLGVQRERGREREEQRERSANIKESAALPDQTKRPGDSNRLHAQTRVPTQTKAAQSAQLLPPQTPPLSLLSSLSPPSLSPSLFERKEKFFFCFTPSSTEQGTRSLRAGGQRPHAPRAQCDPDGPGCAPGGRGGGPRPRATSKRCGRRRRSTGRSSLRGPPAPPCSHLGRGRAGNGRARRPRRARQVSARDEGRPALSPACSFRQFLA
jgi:hypothetical protein